MSRTDNNTEGRKPESNSAFTKVFKTVCFPAGRRLLVLLIILLALAVAVLWMATTAPRPQLNRPLLWRIKQILPWFRRPQTSRVVCGTNLSGLFKALQVYASDSDGRYPPPNKWCDLLVDLDFTTTKQFLCIDALRVGDRGPCHYAINPSATPNSPANVVLLFETQAGWNQFGGPEILAIRRHGRLKGCYIAFADGRIRFVEAKDLKKLKWKAEKLIKP